jgi:hypothetical protein
MTVGFSKKGLVAPQEAVGKPSPSPPLIKVCMRQPLAATSASDLAASRCGNSLIARGLALGIDARYISEGVLSQGNH